MRLVLLRYLHFICIFIDTIKSELLTLTLTFHSNCEDLNYHPLFQHERRSQLRFTPLTITVYLSHLANRTPSHHLSSIRSPKYKRNDCFFFLQEIGRRITKSILKWYLYQYRKWSLYQYKTSVLDGNWLHTLLVKAYNAWIQPDTTPK